MDVCANVCARRLSWMSVPMFVLEDYHVCWEKFRIKKTFAPNYVVYKMTGFSYIRN